MSGSSPDGSPQNGADLADFRQKLLHADDVGQAIETAVAFLEGSVGAVTVVPADPISSPATPATSVGGQRRVDLVCDAPVGPDGRLGLLDAVRSDLNRMIELLESRAAKERLDQAVAEKDALLQQTTDALFRDAGEVVRILGELERRDNVMRAELHRALRFQRAMISPLPRENQMVFDAVYLAADVISADFYDVAMVGPGHARLFVADATGHGIAAALATMFVKAEYEAQKRSCETSSELIASLNDVLTSRYETLDLRCTAVCIDIYPVRGVMAFTTAAHPGPLLVRAGKTEFLSGGNTFMGLRSGVTYQSTEVGLEPGDLVVAFTDGVLDASDSTGCSFGRERLKDLAERAQQEPSSFGSFVVSELSSFVGEGRALMDDVTMLAAWLPPRSA